MSLSKVPFLISSMLCVHLVVNPPNLPTAPQGRYNRKGLGASVGKITRWIPLISMCVFWLGNIVELATILTYSTRSFAISRTILSTLVQRQHPSFYASNILLDPVFLSGWYFVTAGCLVCLLCYRELGSFYNPSLTTSKNHKLIRTGPYAIVRHPSYMGTALAALGATLCHLSRGSWLIECSGILEGDLGCVLGLMWLLAEVALIGTSIATRIPQEDRMLKQRFGKEWTVWAGLVRYKLIPGVY